MAENARAPEQTNYKTLRHMVGPGLLVAVGYMDPGNWVTDIAGGAGYGYGLLGVVVVSCLMALGFQLLVSRITLATGRDLAAISRKILPRPLMYIVWFAGEAAIIATALAEIVGGGIALGLLFGFTLPTGMLVTAVLTLAVIGLSHRTERLLERVVNLLLAVVAAAFITLLWWSKPDWAMAAKGVVAAPALLRDHTALLVALGILGATIMPHNLYLHAGLVLDRVRTLDPAARHKAWRMTVYDTATSLTLAMLVNAAILMVAAAALPGLGLVVASLADAHHAMTATLGAVAGLIFAVALYAAGQSSAITGVLAGRILTRGFAGHESSAWLRGLATRVLALVLAFSLPHFLSHNISPDFMMMLSQVVLSLALPFALLPMLLAACSRKVMGPMRPHMVWLGLAVAATLVLCALDLVLLF